MRKPIVIALTTVLLVGLLIGLGLLTPRSPTIESALAQGATFVGAETCKTCHTSDYDHWKASGHAYKLRTAEEARLAGLPKPSYVTWDDILFVIGGFDWKARYIDKKGYIITQSADGTIQGQNQFNLETERFVDYEKGKVKPYDCGSCHTTGYSPEGHQMGLEGLIGAWAFNGIQCEACHGPGSEHARSGDKTKITIDTSAASCGTCHSRGTDMAVIPAKDGFIEHHEQYQELLQSPHKDLSCTTCHKPHRTSGLSIKPEATCSSCHAAQATEFTDSAMQKAGVSCEDCHMAEATKSAVKRGPFEGDVMTHLFRINSDPAASMFTDDGKFAKGFLTLEYACFACHADRDKAWAAQYAPNAHTLGK